MPTIDFVFKKQKYITPVHFKNRKPTQMLCQVRNKWTILFIGYVATKIQQVAIKIRGTNLINKYLPLPIRKF
jgi:hypothetical protein